MKRFIARSATVICILIANYASTLVAAEDKAQLISDKYELECVDKFMPLIDRFDPNQTGGAPDVKAAEKARREFIEIYPVCMDLIQQHIDYTRGTFPGWEAYSKCANNIATSSKRLDNAEESLEILKATVISDAETHKKAHSKASIAIPMSISTALSKISGAHLWLCPQKK